MAFTNLQGRTQTSLSEINVVPLVDVVLVLLIIFMLTAPIIQSGIEVNVPKTKTVNELTKELLVVSINRKQRHPEILFLFLGKTGYFTFVLVFQAEFFHDIISALLCRDLLQLGVLDLTFLGHFNRFLQYFFHFLSSFIPLFLRL